MSVGRLYGHLVSFQCLRPSCIRYAGTVGAARKQKRSKDGSDSSSSPPVGRAKVFGSGRKSSRRGKTSSRGRDDSPEPAAVDVEAVSRRRRSVDPTIEWSARFAETMLLYKDGECVSVVYTCIEVACTRHVWVYSIMKARLWPCSPIVSLASPLTFSHFPRRGGASLQY